MGSNGSATYSITKRPVTITAKDQTITYGGSISTGASQVTISGQVSGHTVKDDITLTPSITNAGEGTITPSDATIMNGSTNVTTNYDITYADGTLTINKAPASISYATTIVTKTFGDASFSLVRFLSLR